MSSEYTEQDWMRVRDTAVLIGQAAQALTVDQIQAAIEHADRALSIGPILDPTAFIRGRDELNKQVRYLRALLAFRCEVDSLIVAGAVASQ